MSFSSACIEFYLINTERFTSLSVHTPLSRCGSLVLYGPLPFLSSLLPSPRPLSAKEMLNAFLVLCILPTLVRSQYLPTPIRPQCLPTPVKPQCTPLVIEWETYNATYVATYDKSTQVSFPLSNLVSMRNGINRNDGSRSANTRMFALLDHQPAPFVFRPLPLLTVLIHQHQPQSHAYL